MTEMTVVEVQSWKRVSDSLLLATVIFEHSRWKSDLIELKQTDDQPSYIQLLWQELINGDHGDPERE